MAVAHMFIFIYVCVCVCMRTHACMRVWVRACVCTCVHMRVFNKQTRLHRNTYRHIHSHRHTHTCNTYTHLPTCAYLYLLTMYTHLFFCIVIADASSTNNDHDESQDLNMAAMTGSYVVTMNQAGSDPFTPQDSFEECQNWSAQLHIETSHCVQCACC